ncbi:achaete-scute homolog 5 [Pipistrellus kuhlii]|uniref:achaete-scute homolog 5 n=1 Tax=Pipistrellus kuhlii TaxID=59472 RepID=UPI001E26FD0F|nr:achaete-scute homolog 5 [Pipistrellus kuhlii]
MDRGHRAPNGHACRALVQRGPAAPPGGGLDRGHRPLPAGPPGALPLLLLPGPVPGARPPPCAPGAPQPGLGLKRNERERHRVRCVNQGFARLRGHLPRAPAGRRLSKVETLRAAARYIRHLQELLRAAPPGSEPPRPEPPRDAPPGPEPGESGQ